MTAQLKCYFATYSLKQITMAKNCWIIDHDFKHVEFENAQKALLKNNWLFIVEIDIIPEKKLEITDILIFSREDRIGSNKLKFNSWSASIESIWDVENGFKARYKFISPDGRIKSLDMGWHRGLDNIIHAIRTLVELDKFENWETYELTLENRSLKKENDVFKTQIIDLKNEIKELKEKLISEQ